MKRDEAFRLGLTTYEADRPCKANHWPSKRYVSTGACTKCQAMYKKTYSHSLLKVQVPHDLKPQVIQMLQAFGCIVHGQDAQQSHTSTGLDTGWRPTPPALPPLPPGPVFLKPGD